MHQSLLLATTNPDLSPDFVSRFLFSPFLKWLPLQHNSQIIRKLARGHHLGSQISVVLEHSPEITWLPDATLPFHWLMFFQQWHPTLFLDNCRLWRKLSHTICPRTACFLWSTRKDERPSCSGSYDLHESACLPAVFLSWHRHCGGCFSLRTLCTEVAWTSS